MIAGAVPAAKETATPGQAAELAARYMEEGASASDAAKRAAAETGVKKGEIYRLIAR